MFTANQTRHKNVQDLTSHESSVNAYFVLFCVQNKLP